MRVGLDGFSTMIEQELVAAAPGEERAPGPPAAGDAVEPYQGDRVPSGVDTPWKTCVVDPGSQQDLREAAREYHGTTAHPLWYADDVLWKHLYPRCPQPTISGGKVLNLEQRDPQRFFRAAGFELVPVLPHLYDGARFLLEAPGSPSSLAPVEVHLDERRHVLRVSFLDGHPLRGYHELRLEPDGQGGTRIEQHSQLQTRAGELVPGRELDAEEEVWGRIHQELARVRP
jgi:hypothetical protein